MQSAKAYSLNHDEKVFSAQPPQEMAESVVSYMTTQEEQKNIDKANRPWMPESGGNYMEI